MVKASVYNAGDLGSITGSGRSPGERNGHPLQYSCLESRLQSMGSQRVGHNWATSLSLFHLGHLRTATSWWSEIPGVSPFFFPCGFLAWGWPFCLQGTDITQGRSPILRSVPLLGMLWRQRLRPPDWLRNSLFFFPPLSPKGAGLTSHFLSAPLCSFFLPLSCRPSEHYFSALFDGWIQKAPFLIRLQVHLWVPGCFI